MIPGPDFIYACKQCGRKVRCPSMLSGNTFGGTVYPDGKGVFPMMLDYLNLVKCKNCGHFFWLSKCRNYKTIPWNAPNTKDTDKATELSASDYCLALESPAMKKTALNKNDELVIRVQLWWAFNHRYRMKKKMFMTDQERCIYVSNGQRLLQLLNQRNPHQKKMIIELQRNIARVFKGTKTKPTLVLTE